MLLTDQRVLVVGGSSGIGLASARAAAAADAKVTLASSNEDKLNTAAKGFDPAPQTVVMDVTSDESVSGAMEEIGEVDHLVYTASRFQTDRIKEMLAADAQTSFETKFWGAYRCAQMARVKAGGSIVLTSGIYSRRPTAGVCQLAACNGGIESMAKSLALELAPTRVNVICPGLTDTPTHDHMDAEDRRKLFEQVANKLPTGRAAQPEQIALGVLFLLTNAHVTGQTLVVDGGGELV